MRCKYCGQEILDDKFVDIDKTHRAHFECFKNYLFNMDELTDFMDFDSEEVSITDGNGIWSYST